MNLIRIVSCGALLLASILPPSVRADEDLGFRNILNIGCHQVNGTCYLTLDGASFGGPEGCRVNPTNEVRWDDADQANGRRTFAALYGAFLAGRRVAIAVSGCTVQGYPAVLYYQVQ